MNIKSARDQFLLCKNLGPSAATILLSVGLLNAASGSNLLRKFGRWFMAVKKVGEKYLCNICGNEVAVTKVGGGELVCCNQPMEKIAG